MASNSISTSISKAAKVIKVPGAKVPKMQSSIPTAPKLPQLQSNLNPYSSTKIAKLPKGL